MKNLKFLAIIGVVLVIGVALAGCASWRLDYLEQDTVSGPKQVRQGQDINPREITVWGVMQNGSRRVQSISSSDITFNKHTPGVQTVRVRVGIIANQEVSFETEVMALRSLSIDTLPRVILFKQGDEPDPKWPGLVIRGEWDSMGSHVVDLDSCEISGFLREQSGRQTIRVTYEGMLTTFDIDVRGMAGIELAQGPTKLIYVQGESLDLTGLRVTGSWGEGFPDEELEITESDITGFNMNNVGSQRLSVTKNGRTAYFNVEVLALTSILLEKPPNKTDYKVGESLDLSGILVTGNFTGADPSMSRTEYVPVDQLTAEGFDSNRIGRGQSVTIIVRGQRANFFVNIEE